eukprot:snap_masked-scaffold495_size155559-processed-gene-0.5 protein:Tk09240 transcript:snap_masked-scaffold495_size155559-processed-gene-0.5-mRNA-1 annotation:"hypothetical protein LOTGIDRAFT_232463"
MNTPPGEGTDCVQEGPTVSFKKMEPKSCESIWSRLSHHSKLERDQGVAELEEILKNQTHPGLGAALRVQCQRFIATLGEETPWESKLGMLLTAQLLIRHAPESALESWRPFVDLLTESSVSLLGEREEVRVRGLAAHVLGEMCAKIGPEIYLRVKDRVLESIRTNLERESERLVMEDGANGSEASSPDEDARSVTSADGIFHDTAGWKNLESSMQCLEYMVGGCGTRFQPFITPELMELIVTALKHTNRFVRETGYQALTSFLRTGKLSVMDGTALQERIPSQFAQHIATGLADNWSQVRLAASVAARELFLSLSDDETKKEGFYPVLLPRLCLNRYYMAEGVKLYNQTTWKLTVGQRGSRLVETYIKEVIQYYVQCTHADNHAVREAACHCIAELAAKISPKVLEPHVPQLLEVLHECFGDESWPVRDTACVASGNFVKAYPKQAKGKVAALIPLFVENLKDPISSVRQGAALSLANVLSAYEDEVYEEVIGIFRDGLDGLADQPVESHRYTDLSASPATFGVVKKMRDNDIELHENQPMFSCGSLAPKMGRGGASGGCSSAKFKKISEPWEMADGCIHLFAEITAVSHFHAQLHPLLAKISQACYKRHYTLHLSFIETVLQCVPQMADNLGKRLFKPYMDDFWDPIFYALQSENALAQVASEQCLAFLSEYLGPNILKGRVEQQDVKYLELLEQAMAQTASVSTTPMEVDGRHPALHLKIPHRNSGQADFQPLGGTPT